jgi:small subunit ribosomal protein S8|uniref:Ribosomal protein S8 n=1 Tax=Poterioochromonas malhamensis TaxID=88167 RepID=A0A7T7BWA7_9STRA|nr:ribosomal protein S8 [Poterioochromonas malhamensis]QQK54991.1 ribosomal protein S8 [Poterioochromonas malhamensis]
MVKDLISDMLTRIRNASLAKHSFVNLQYSKQACDILKIFTKEGYIMGYTVEKSSHNFIKVYLKYKGSWIKTSFISQIIRISKPGQRIYTSYRNFYKTIKYLKYNEGIGIISTSNGVMNHFKAYYYKKGGEIICYIK